MFNPLVVKESIFKKQEIKVIIRTSLSEILEGYSKYCLHLKQSAHQTNTSPADEDITWCVFVLSSYYILQYLIGDVYINHIIFHYNFALKRHV